MSSTSTVPKPENANHGTGDVTWSPYEEPSFDHSTSTLFGQQHKDQFQTISAQTECSKFSLEELRIEDYARWKRGPAYEVGAVRTIPKGHFASSLHDIKSHDTVRIGINLNLLRGSGIEVHVGTPKLDHIDIDDSNSHIWTLPKAMISYYSPFLKAACLRNLKQTEDRRIELPDEDATVFSLFVQWMYYGTYSYNPLTEQAGYENENLNIDVRCWVLGDSLLCTKFKNYTMSRIYQHHMNQPFCKTLTTDHIRYACDNSAPESKLRQFYFAFAVFYFALPHRLQGTTEEWDELLLDHSDLRLRLLQHFRMGSKWRDFIGSEDEYLEREDSLATSFEKLEVGNAGS